MKKRGRPEKDKEGKDHRNNSGSIKGGDQGGSGSKEEANKTGDSAPLDDDSENQGFGTWLRSTDGVEMMRLFVIANSLLVFVTMAWPNMQEALYILKDYIMGEEEE